MPVVLNRLTVDSWLLPEESGPEPLTCPRIISARGVQSRQLGDKDWSPVPGLGRLDLAVLLFFLPSAAVPLSLSVLTHCRDPDSTPSLLYSRLASETQSERAETNLALLLAPFSFHALTSSDSCSRSGTICSQSTHRPTQGTSCIGGLDVAKRPDGPLARLTSVSLRQ
ncbi:uncharacterized protein F5Z01DRAFT_104845 [Emericellopsis atlantica]|uniref:Uncharacterized protein n=1 Tax=Emericellopsis atlantica TaxID=2614577 RepID=A0A9P8CR70_9HYPO|nr:uncharacterized protein F5Z01DRAFT_104845 [Emericellopsis atlantica]KAG9254416.1 hypothetical protein F5Z01DRAFT_104845 [Emericellopsis atlantica]